MGAKTRSAVYGHMRLFSCAFFIHLYIKKSIEKWNSIVTKNMSDKEKKELKRLLSMAIENIKEEI